MRDYHYRNVGSQYGAPMGRRSYHASPEYEGKVRIERVPMVDGDYDPGGAYWGGGGTPLFVVWSTDEDADGNAIDYFERGKSRDAVKASVRARYPKARFYR